MNQPTITNLYTSTIEWQVATQNFSTQFIRPNGYTPP